MRTSSWLFGDLLLSFSFKVPTGTAALPGGALIPRHGPALARSSPCEAGASGLAPDSGPGGSERCPLQQRGVWRARQCSLALATKTGSAARQPTADKDKKKKIEAQMKSARFIMASFEEQEAARVPQSPYLKGYIPGCIGVCIFYRAMKQHHKTFNGRHGAALHQSRE